MITSIPHAFIALAILSFVACSSGGSKQSASSARGNSQDAFDEGEPKDIPETFIQKGGPKSYVSFYIDYGKGEDLYGDAILHSGLLVKPTGFNKKTPMILGVHDRKGFDEDAAEKQALPFVALGYPYLAIDLYRGDRPKGTSAEESLQKLVFQMGEAELIAQFNQAVQFLQDNQLASTIVIAAFGDGSISAINALASGQNSQYGAMVLFYPDLGAVSDKADYISVPTFILGAAEDGSYTDNEWSFYRDEFRSRSVHIKFEVLKNLDKGFMDPLYRVNYDGNGAKSAANHAMTQASRVMRSGESANPEASEHATRKVVEKEQKAIQEQLEKNSVQNQDQNQSQSQEADFEFQDQSESDPQGEGSQSQDQDSQAGSSP